MPLQILRQDLTKMQVDAIVNSTNREMVGYSGLDLAVHTAAGKALDDACRALTPLALGEVVITDGFGLPCRHILHTVGPVWQGGDKGEEEALRACYENLLALAVEKGLETVAFPLISSGAYGFPKDRVLTLAVAAISQFLLENELTVYLCVYDRQSYSFSKRLFRDILDYMAENEEITANACPDAAFEEAPPIEAKRTCFEHPPILRRADIGKPPRPKAGTKADLPLEDYLRLKDESFRERLFRLIDERGLTDVVCYKRANLDKRTFSKIKSGKGYRPSKQTVVALAVSLCLTLDETQELLATVGLTLSKASTFDMIIRYFLERRIYDMAEINQTLFEFDQLLLGSF